MAAQLEAPVQVAVERAEDLSSDVRVLWQRPPVADVRVVGSCSLHHPDGKYYDYGQQ